MLTTDFNTLLATGNIGFYESCEVTQLFLVRKFDKKIINFFILACLEEKSFVSRNHHFLTTKPIKVSDEYSLGIQRYWLSVNEVRDVFTNLVEHSKWNFDGNDTLDLGTLEHLSKQYIPSTEGNRLNYILKNNFRSGSYLIEFFDKAKEQIAFLLDIRRIKLLNEVNDELLKTVPLNLSVARDRIGNIVFQFPVTIIEASSKALSSWEGIKMRFVWHHKIQTPPDCLIHLEATLEKNFMGAAINDYNKTESQILKVGNIDQLTSVKLWRKEPNLLLSTFTGTYIREFVLNTGIISHEPRLFEINGKPFEVTLTGTEISTGKQGRRYTTFINGVLYDREQQELEKSLSFKQYYAGDEVKALQDLRKLIKQYGKHGIYLWDPFLRAQDIFNTLYFSPISGVPLKAVGGTGPSTKTVYKAKGMNASQIIAAERVLFENPSNNNLGLNLEFRMQHGNHGWPFHDRFLLFPGTEDDRPKVYSLGTSINSIGQSHHILQEVSHPRRVVDAFEDLWESLNHQDCIVWKFPVA